VKCASHGIATVVAHIVNLGGSLVWKHIDVRVEMLSRNLRVPVLARSAW